MPPIISMFLLSPPLQCPLQDLRHCCHTVQSLLYPCLFSANDLIHTDCIKNTSHKNYREFSLTLLCTVPVILPGHGTP